MRNRTSVTGWLQVAERFQPDPEKNRSFLEEFSPDIGGAVRRGRLGSDQSTAPGTVSTSNVATFPLTSLLAVILQNRGKVVALGFVEFRLLRIKYKSSQPHLHYTHWVRVLTSSLRLGTPMPVTRSYPAPAENTPLLPCKMSRKQEPPIRG